MQRINRKRREITFLLCSLLRGASFFFLINFILFSLAFFFYFLFHLSNAKVIAYLIQVTELDALLARPEVVVCPEPKLSEPLCAFSLSEMLDHFSGDFQLARLDFGEKRTSPLFTFLSTHVSPESRESAFRFQSLHVHARSFFGDLFLLLLGKPHSDEIGDCPNPLQRES